VLASKLSNEELTRILATQYRRPWITYLHPTMSKQRFLGYAARYARRLPIAQRRILNVSRGRVVFTTKDKRRSKEKGREVWVETALPAGEFVAALSEHVHDRYRHAIRYFGLLSPRTRPKTFAALFTVLGQRRRTRPPRLSWQESLKRYFDVIL
jgi:CRP-like cAMP-binding protein